MDEGGDITVQEVEADPDAAPPTRPSQPLPEVFVVAVGAASHGLASLERLFDAVPPASGAAWVVTFRHDESVSTEEIMRRLSTVAPWPLQIAENGQKPEPDHLYVAPSDQLLTFDDGELRLAPLQVGPGGRGAVDSFMSSLAQSHGRAALGVLLAGLGSQGTAGVTALKEGGGLLVCERDNARNDELHPLSDPSGLADFVLPAAEIAPRIVQYIEHLKASPEGLDEAAVESEIAEQIGRIAAVLRNRTGHDFHGYKHGTFLRRIQRRMQVNALDTVDVYIDFLRSDTDEVHHLFQDLLIGVTQFFRDKPEFELLEREVIPKLFQGKGAGDQVRLWVLGCATGEEAYSLAMLLREHMATLEPCPRCRSSPRTSTGGR